MQSLTERNQDSRQRKSPTPALKGFALRETMRRRFARQCFLLAVVLAITVYLTGCAQIRIPRIDPTGNSIFLPPQYSTEILTPGTVASNQAGPPPSVAFPRNVNPGPPAGNVVGPATSPTYPAQPAFAHPADPQSCDPNCQSGRQGFHLCNHRDGHVVPHPGPARTNGESGQIILTPSRIVAPVGSEVVVLAGICGGDGYYVVQQPVEWILSNDSVGQFIEVGASNGPHPGISRLMRPEVRKFDGSYALGRTQMKDILLTRGTPTPVDDIQLLKGQTYVSVSSESPGTSYVTCVAPDAVAWDKRRQSTVIHWVDGTWSIPVPSLATAGTVHPLTTRVTSSTDGGGLDGWKVNYTIIGGAPAEFAPMGSQSASTETDPNGEATVQLRQPAGQFEPGTTQIRVDVIRPAMFGERELQVESGVTSVTWSAPALTIRAIGPRTAGIDESFNYRIEVTNPGDQVARGVVVRTRDFGEQAEFISSTPKPVEYGNSYEWNLGDVAPGAPASVIDVQLKSNSRGNVNMCFEVASESDGLRTEACAQTEIAAPCIGLELEGPTEASVGDEVTFNITLVNQCDETLSNVELVVNYDQGLVATGLGNPIRFNVAQLRFGEPRVVPLTFRIIEAGQRCFDLAVTADGGHTARARRCVEASVSANNSVDLVLEGQQRTAVGQTALVRGIVTNNGGSPLNQLVVTARFPESLRPVGVTDDYPQGTLGRDLAFNVGRLEPGQQAIIEIQFVGEAADGNAFTEMTVTSATSDASDSERINIRVERAQGQIGIPQDGAQTQPPPAGNPPAGNPPPTQPRNPGGLNQGGQNPGGIGIPGDPVTRGDLRIQVRALDREVNVGDVARFQFVVINDRQVADQNVNITLLIPPGMEFFDFDPGQGGLRIEGRKADLTEFYLGERLEMRPGEQLPFTISLRASQAGSGTFEVQATSARTAGTAFGRDTVSIIGQ
ncbi:MAG: hypothetical protein AAF456_15820 [Planctomycetota bacterium]